MITRIGHIMEAMEMVKAIHPEVRWEAEGSRLSLIIPANFDVEQTLADMSTLLGPR